MARRKRNSHPGSKGNDTRNRESGRASDVKEAGATVPPGKDEGQGADTKVPASNDPEWYGRDAQLLRDAASLPFSLPLGDPTKLYGDANADIVPTSGSTKLRWSNQASILDSSIYGVCTLKLRPSIGSNSVKTDPINVCANAFYTHVRYVNSGRKNYDPADLMIYALAFADIYSFTLWVQRLYSYAFMYSQKNKYIAKSLITANGIDPDNITQNLANFRYWLNAWINKVSSFAVPADIFFFKRRAFLYANYYIENPVGNIKDQLYQFAPVSFMKFGLDTDGKGCLIHSDMDFTTPWKLSNIVAYANDLMSNITGDEDFGLMSGDVLKAYGANIISLAPIPEDAGLLPVYDPYVLSQFKNATLINNYKPMDTYTYAGNTWMNGSVMQTSDGLIVSKNFATVPHISNALTAEEAAQITLPITAKKLMTVENPTPTPDDVVEASRLMVCDDGSAIAEDTGSGTQVFFNSGTEICISCNTTRFHYAGTSVLVEELSTTDRTIQSIVSTTSGNESFGTKSFAEMMSIIGFKYSPTRYAAFIHNNSGYLTVQKYYPFGNLDNYTYVDSILLSKIHECALLSLFYVPGVAKMVNNI